MLAPLLRPGGSPAAFLARALGAMNRGWPRAAIAWSRQARPAPDEVDLALTDAWIRELATACQGGPTGAVPGLAMRLGSSGSGSRPSGSRPSPTRPRSPRRSPRRRSRPWSPRAPPTGSSWPAWRRCSSRPSGGRGSSRGSADRPSSASCRSTGASSPRRRATPGSRRPGGSGSPYRAIDALLRGAAGDVVELAPGPLREALAQAAERDAHRPPPPPRPSARGGRSSGGSSPGAWRTRCAAATR